MRCRSKLRETRRTALRVPCRPAWVNNAGVDTHHIQTIGFSIHTKLQPTASVLPIRREDTRLHASAHRSFCRNLTLFFIDCKNKSNQTAAPTVEKLSRPPPVCAMPSATRIGRARKALATTRGVAAELQLRMVLTRGKILITLSRVDANGSIRRGPQGGNNRARLSFRAGD